MANVHKPHVLGELRERSDFRKILIIGSGPIVIGQAGEFDSSGTQACTARCVESSEGLSVAFRDGRGR